MEVWKQYVGKKVFVILKNNRKYAGQLLEVTDVINGLCWLTVLDINNNKVTFANGEISMLQEEK